MTEENTITLESEAGFRVLFQYATVGNVVVDKEGKIVIVNPNAVKLFGYGSKKIVGQPLALLLPPSQKKNHTSRHKECFRSPRAGHIQHGLDLFASRKEGSVFPAEINPGHYESGREQLTFKFITNSTRRDAAEQEFLNEKEERKRRESGRTMDLENKLYTVLPHGQISISSEEGKRTALIVQLKLS